MFQEKSVNPLFMLLVMIFSFFMGIVILLTTFLNYYCAKSLKLRKNHTFCLVVSALTMVSFPIGTILGVPAMIVLLRESVKKVFQSEGELV